MNKYAWVAVLSMLLVVCAVGCPGKKGGSADSGGVAVVDPIRAATELGVQGKYQQYVNDAKDLLTQEAQRDTKDKVLDYQKQQKVVNDMVGKLSTTQKEMPVQELLKENKPLADAVEKMQKQEAEIRQIIADKQKKLQDYDASLKDLFNGDLQKAIATVAEAKGIKMMLPKAGCLHVGGGVDVTDSVIAELKKIKIKELPKYEK